MVKSVKEVLVDDFWIMPATPEYLQEGVPYITSKNIKNGVIDFSNVNYISQESYESISKNRPIQCGDILISMIGTLGETAEVTTEDGKFYGQNMFLVRLDESQINKRYFLNYFNSSFVKRALAGSQNQSTQRYLKANHIEDLQIPIPEIFEQERIANKLDKLSRIIEQRKSELVLMDDLIKARFVELFGDVATEDYKYETKKLGEVAEVGSSHRVFTSEFVEKGIPFYRGTEIGELANGQIPSNPYYISEEHYNRLASDETKPEVGDLLMPSICNKGQVWMVDTEEPFYYKDGRVLCISPDREVYNPKYLQYFMKVKTEVEYPKMGSGSTFAEFKIFLLKDFDILTPPRKLQDAFTTFVEQVDKSKVVVQKALDKAQLLFDSLMQEYFG